MPETPDFESIARRLSGVWADRGAIEGMTESVAEQLRLVWNARGAADVTLFAGDQDHRDILERIRSLDR